MSESIIKLEDRIRLKNLYDAGFTKAKQLIKLTKISKSTVYDILNRIKSGQSMARKPQSGPRKKLAYAVHFEAFWPYSDRT